MNTKPRRDGKARNLSREELKVTAIMRQIEEMEQKLGARKQDRGCAEREVRRGARSLKTRQRKRPRTSRRVASKAKAKGRLWRRESVPCPRKATRPKSSSMKTE
jgi:hypothetical protein